MNIPTEQAKPTTPDFRIEGAPRQVVARHAMVAIRACQRRLEFLRDALASAPDDEALEIASVVVDFHGLLSALLKGRATTDETAWKKFYGHSFMQSVKRGEVAGAEALPVRTPAPMMGPPVDSDIMIPPASE